MELCSLSMALFMQPILGLAIDRCLKILAFEILGVKSIRLFEGNNTVMPKFRKVFGTKMEREKRFELSTLSLATRCSTTELFPLVMRKL